MKKKYRHRRVKISVPMETKRCKYCGEKLKIYLDEMWNHIMLFHLADLAEDGIPADEIAKFKEGFTWESPSSISQPL